ncbi:ATP-dependent nuclease subunit B [Streptococcus dentapri]|uniref:ATP-dependent nuclease subunit B n=1 Tax=Streptococcus dentapri TaxID=573564 RepID=A0ABV8CZX2_9STRE
MRLLYTDIRNHLTDQLANLAADYARAGHRVFYIAPNSLSFEKERRVLERLPEGASFAITITRFAQMARYFVLNDISDKKPLTETGLSMIFFRVLSQLEEGQLKLYGSLRKDPNFIKQLVELYQELQRSNLTIFDLDKLESDFKYQDLLTIFSAFYQVLQEENFESQTKITQFLAHVEEGQLDRELKKLVLIVDGFSRFSAEEEALITALHNKGAEILIGTYASPKAYRASFLGGNLYQANVEFLLGLGQKFKVKAEWIGQKKDDALAHLSNALEARHDFSNQLPQLSAADKKAIAIWDVVNQKEEVEHVAKAIRQKLQQGVRYKDILVLLGDVEAYQLQIGKIFDKYDIPYYFGKAEAMSHHPLVNFVESLARIKRYNFRAEDVLNLVKSGLFKDLSEYEIDKFEQYVKYADIKGRSKFSRDFTANIQQGVDGAGQARYKYDLEQINRTRQSIIEPLTELFKSRGQLGQNLVSNKFLPFLETIKLAENMTQLTQGRSELAIEKEGEVWKTLSDLLQEIYEIFGDEKLKIDDFLALLQTGMQASNYRLVPATVDVVTIKDYELIEPHTNRYVFAIGLSAGNFPRLHKNSSLITDNERSQLNEKLTGQGFFELADQENVKKNHSALISLLNSATDELVLSAPQIVNENEDKPSPYLQELLDLGIEPISKRAASFDVTADDLGTYKALLSRLIEANHLAEAADLDQEEQTFWSVMVRRLRQKLDQGQIEIPIINNDLKIEPLSPNTLAILYPSNQPLRLSASSLMSFYNNQYAYFLRHVLRLEEEDSVHPDFRNHGVYLHKIFEKVMAEDQTEDFDSRLERAIDEVSRGDLYQTLYHSDQEGCLTQDILLDIARSTAIILKNNDNVQVLDKASAKHYLGTSDWQQIPSGSKALELNFAYQLSISDQRKLEIRGQIDRVDQLRFSDSLGVVDYKSGDQKFNLGDFYNGLSPQLLTYMLALQERMPADYQAPIFGAMYLHMQDPELKLKDLASLDDAAQNMTKSFKYQGLYNAEEAKHLNKYYNTSKTNNFSQQELELMLDYTKRLYQEAAQTILSGRFAINPYTKDGRSVQGEQLKNITGFEADLHMKYARRLLKGKREDYLDRMKGGED